MKKELLGVLYIPLLVIGLLNLPDRLGILLLTWPFLGSLLLHMLAKIYGAGGSFRTSLAVWLISHTWWLALVALMPLGLLQPIVLMILVLLTGKAIIGGLRSLHGIKKGVAGSVSILYGVFLYIFYVAEVQTSVFYAILLFMLYLNRKRLTREAFALLYRTHAGLKTMDKLAVACPSFLKIIGLISILLGFVGMVFISGYVVYNVFQLLFVPGAVPAVTPLLPGIQMPGSEISLPLAYGILSLFIVVVLHEFCHGVIARVYQVPVKSSGLVLFGPLVGAFVEPDEIRLSKEPAKVQLSIFSIGPISNIMAAVIVLFVIIPFVLAPVTDVFFEPKNVTITAVREAGPAARAGITPSLLISVAEKNVRSAKEFTESIKSTTPGKEMIIQTDKGTFTVVPDAGEKHPLIGITLQESIGIKSSYTQFGFLPWVIIWLNVFMLWFFIISVGVGIANLLPIGPLDGGRMLKAGLSAHFTKQEGEWLWKWVGLSLFLAIMFILLFPLFKWVLP